MSNPIQIPPLYCPFPADISPYAERVQAELNQWMSDHGYLKTERAQRRFKAAKFGWITCRVHPHADFDQLVIVGIYMSWLFMLDDLCDEADLGHRPAALKTLHDRLLDYMIVPREPTPGDDEVIVGLHDIWTRMRAHSTTEWAVRFIGGFAAYTRACQWEADNRARGVTPATAAYIEQRRYTSALYIFFDLIELADRVVLPLDVLEHPHVQQLEMLADDGVSWGNDILSLEKEIKSGDVHNLVLVLQHEHRITLQAAADMAGDMFNARMREYVELERALPSFGAAVDAELARYLAGLKYWVRGNIDWSFETGRYGQIVVTQAT